MLKDVARFLLLLALALGVRWYLWRLAWATPSPSPAAANYLLIPCSSTDPCPTPLGAGKGCMWTRCSDNQPFFHRGSDDSNQTVVSQ
jgi:hypothetical protein